MANERPALQGQIVIDATNKWLDFDPGGGEDSVGVTEGTYDDIHALIAHINTLFVGVEPWGVGICSVSDEGIVTIANDEDPADDFAMLWKTGTHGSDNADTHMGHILGHTNPADAADADTAAAVSHVGTYQHMYGWYPSKWPASYGPWKPMAIGGDLQHSRSGSNSKKLHSAFHHTYDVEYSTLPAIYVFTEFATGADLNKDLEHTWKEMAKGNFGTWYTDASDTDSGTKCYLLSPHDWAGAVSRPHKDYHAYNLSMRFRKQES